MNKEWKEIAALIVAMGICIFLCTCIAADPTSKQPREKNCFDIVNQETYEYRD